MDGLDVTHSCTKNKRWHKKKNYKKMFLLFDLYPVKSEYNDHPWDLIKWSFDSGIGRSFN